MVLTLWRSIQWSSRWTMYRISKRRFDFCANILHTGKTQAVLSERPWPQHIKHDYIESAWQSTDSLMAFLEQIDKYHNPPGSEYTSPWLCVMDLASVA
eukprot:5593153-Amphidinium_carterae.1